MNTEIEIFFKETADTLDKINNKLEDFEAKLILLANDAEELTELQKRGLCQIEDKFEKNFNKYVAALSKFAQESNAFWNESREKLRSYHRVQLDAVYSLYIKNLNHRARDIAKEVDKIDTTSVYFKKKMKGQNLKINIWILDSALGDLNTLATKILFNARELGKIIETKTKGT